MTTHYVMNMGVEELRHLYGLHIWRESGQYDITGQLFLYCDPGNPTSSPYNASVTVYESIAPRAIQVAEGAVRAGLTAGETAVSYGTVVLKQANVPSGTMVKLTTSAGGTIDLRTTIADPLHRNPGGYVTSASTPSVFLYIPPDQTSASFDVLVSNAAHNGSKGTISARCAGLYDSVGDCSAVENTDYRMTRLTITVHGKTQ